MTSDTLIVPVAGRNTTTDVVERHPRYGEMIFETRKEIRVLQISTGTTPAAVRPSRASFPCMSPGKEPLACEHDANEKSAVRIHVPRQPYGTGAETQYR